MQIIGYYRVSTTKQGHSGLGLEAQQEQVRRYVQNVGGTLIAEHTEIESGTRNARPVLAQAMTECKKQRATLVIAKLDRLARNVSFISALLDSRIDFVACDVPHADRLLLQMLSVFAEHEARMISERTKAALAAAKARGVILGSHGKVLAAQHKRRACEFAESVAGVISDAQEAGAATLAEVAEFLNAAGLATREGGKWLPMTVARVMRRLNAAGRNDDTSVAA
jgi:DNA invertase Pin-like site-specific DNA recombinase